jgi:hypothetical protein
MAPKEGFHQSKDIYFERCKREDEVQGGCGKCSAGSMEGVAAPADVHMDRDGMSEGSESESGNGEPMAVVLIYGGHAASGLTF